MCSVFKRKDIKDYDDERNDKNLGNDRNRGNDRNPIQGDWLKKIMGEGNAPIVYRKDTDGPNAKRRKFKDVLDVDLKGSAWLHVKSARRKRIKIRTIGKSELKRRFKND